jgi:hypothetical protein
MRVNEESGMSYMKTTVNNIFDGIRVYKDHMAMETVGPEKRLEPKRWMKGTRYHARIQKKWIKRFGIKRRPCILQTPDGFLVHPALWDRFTQQLSSP